MLDTFFYFFIYTITHRDRCIGMQNTAQQLYNKYYHSGRGPQMQWLQSNEAKINKFNIGSFFSITANVQKCRFYFELELSLGMNFHKIYFEFLMHLKNTPYRYYRSIGMQNTVQRLYNKYHHSGRGPQWMEMQWLKIMKPR